MSLSTHCPDRDKVPKDEPGRVQDALQTAMRVLMTGEENRKAARWLLPDAFAALDMAACAVEHACGRTAENRTVEHAFFSRNHLALLTGNSTLPMQ